MCMCIKQQCVPPEHMPTRSVKRPSPQRDKILHKGLIPLSLAVLHHTVDVFPASWVEQWQEEENIARSHISLELCNIYPYEIDLENVVPYCEDDQTFLGICSATASPN